MTNIKKPIYRCTCPKCKTIFDAEYEEFEAIPYGYSSTHRVISCPTCHKEIDFSSKDDIKPMYPRKAKEDKR